METELRDYEPIGADGEVVEFPATWLNQTGARAMAADMLSGCQGFDVNSVVLDGDEGGFWSAFWTASEAGFGAMFDWKSPYEDVLFRAERIFDSLDLQALTTKERFWFESVSPFADASSCIFYSDVELQMDALFRVRGLRTVVIDGIGDDVCVLPVTEQAFQRLLRCPWSDSFYFREPSPPSSSQGPVVFDPSGPLMIRLPTNEESQRVEIEIDGHLAAFSEAVCHGDREMFEKAIDDLLSLDSSSTTSIWGPIHGGWTSLHPQMKNLLKGLSSLYSRTKIFV